MILITQAVCINTLSLLRLKTVNDKRFIQH